MHICAQVDGLQWSWFSVVVVFRLQLLHADMHSGLHVRAKTVTKVLCQPIEFAGEHSQKVASKHTSVFSSRYARTDRC